jgi:outer membrane protein OmpA-like peptidoglycan-associated protein/ABC-type nitrate/sulfonate/bicarbonate transport system substrate-binding protein
MSKHLMAFIAILVVGSLAIIGYKFALPKLKEAWQTETSDAAATKGKLTIGVDGWIGYFPLCSPEMRRRMRARGYALTCDNDGGDYPARFKRLNEDELDFAVTTVDAYVLNGAAIDYPATMIAVIDESKGGDAIIARRSKIANLEALKRGPTVKIAFTPSSPSEHLLKSIGEHFDLPQFRDRNGAWRVPAEGSTDALEKLQKGKVDVAVLWEPDVSRALADPAYVKLIGTEDTEELIVDALLASRRVISEKPEAIQVLLEEYFQTLGHYRTDAAEMRADVAKYAKVEDEQIDAMLGGVAWADVADNGERWFGLTAGGAGAREALIDTINTTVDILLKAGDFSSNPLPGQDPYRLTNSQFVGALYKAANVSPGNAPSSGVASTAFEPLDAQGWSALREVGALKIEPIGFSRGTGTIDEQGATAIAVVAHTLGHYPKYRLQIKGHTGLGGDAGANLELSQRRAEAVMEALSSQFGVDPDRMQGLGFGSSQPLPREPDESDRSYAYRLPRVEFVLLADPR